MLIQAIDYKSNKILKAYKNGIIVWRHFNAKYISFEPNNILIIYKGILGSSNAKQQVSLDNKINLIENFFFKSDKGRSGKLPLKIGMNIFNDYSSSQSREHKKIEIISASSVQPFFSSWVEKGEIIYDIKTDMKILKANSQAKRQNSKILLKNIPLLKLRDIKSRTYIIQEKLLESTLLLLNSSLAKGEKTFLKIIQELKTQYNISYSRIFTFKNQSAEEIRVGLKHRSAQQIILEQFLKENFKAFQRIQQSNQGNIKNVFYDLPKVFFTHLKSVRNNIKWATNFDWFSPLKSRKVDSIVITHNTNTIIVNSLYLHLSKTAQTFVYFHSAKDSGVRAVGLLDIALTASKILKNEITIIQKIITPFYLSHSAIAQLNQFFTTLQFSYLKGIPSVRLVNYIDLEIDTTYSKLKASSSIEEKLFNKVELKLDCVTLDKSPTIESRIFNKILFSKDTAQFYQTKLVIAKKIEYLNAIFERIAFAEPKSFKLFGNHNNIVATEAKFKNRKVYSLKNEHILKFLPESIFVNGVTKEICFIYLNSILEKNIFINGEISEKLIKVCEEIININLFINGNIRKIFSRYFIATSKDFPQIIDKIVYPLSSLQFLITQSTSSLQTSLEREWKTKTFSIIDNYNVLGMSTNLVTFRASEKVRTYFMDILLLQKLYEYKLYTHINSEGRGLLDFFISYNNFNEVINSFNKISIEFTVYKELNKALGQVKLLQDSIIRQPKILEISSGKNYINIYDNITLGMSNYNIITQDFYYNINHYLSAFFTLNFYFQGRAGAYTGFHNFATLNFAGDDEKWHYPIWNSEVEAERNNIFITQVFSFSYNTGEIK